MNKKKLWILTVALVIVLIIAGISVSVVIFVLPAKFSLPSDPHTSK